VDVQNAYLRAVSCEEKIWTTPGPEFGEDEDKKALIESFVWSQEYWSLLQQAHFRMHEAIRIPTLQGYS